MRGNTNYRDNMNILRRLFGRSKPTESEIKRISGTLSEARAREILGTTDAAGDGTSPEAIKYAAALAIAQAEVDGKSLEFSLIVKYRGKGSDEAARLLTEDEIGRILKLAKIVPSEKSDVRRADAARVFDAMRLLSTYE